MSMYIETNTGDPIPGGAFVEFRVDEVGIDDVPGVSQMCENHGK